jgi:hypothetical protein
VTWVCQALALSHATYYRWQAAAPGANQDLEVRAQIQDIALERPAYGYRRITYELQRCGLVVNHKRGRRLMRAVKRDSLGLDLKGMDLRDLDAVLTRLMLDRSILPVAFFRRAPPTKQSNSSSASCGTNSQATVRIATSRKPSISRT